MGPFITDRCSDKHLSSPFGTYGILLIPLQIGPPQIQCHTCCHGGPSNPFALPLSALYQWFVGTFHAG